MPLLAAGVFGFDAFSDSIEVVELVEGQGEPYDILGCCFDSAMILNVNKRRCEIVVVTPRKSKISERVIVLEGASSRS